MSAPNYTRTITVKNTPDAAYRALTGGIENWWTKPDTPLTSLGDRAKFSFPPGKSFWTFEATVLTPNERVEMRCVEALHLHEGQPKEIEKEWLGTRVIWEIIPNGDETDIRVEHMGLVPTLHCYEVCEAGWDLFFVASLKAYLDTGIGHPHKS